MSRDPVPKNTEIHVPTTSHFGSEVVGRLVDLLVERNEQDAEKATKIRELITSDFDGEDPDALFPFSGGITQRKDGRWDTLSGSEVSELGLITVGKARVIAGTEVARLFPNTTIVTNSYNRFDSDQLTMAAVVKEAFVRRNISPERIELEEESVSTITQFTEMIKMAVEKNWRNVTVITNGYNIPRATTQYEMLDTIVEDDEFQEILRQFYQNEGRVSIVNADTIMETMSEHFAIYLEKVKQTDAYQKTLCMEAKGLDDLHAGKYRVVLNPEEPRS